MAITEKCTEANKVASMDAAVREEADTYAR